MATDRRLGVDGGQGRNPEIDVSAGDDGPSMSADDVFEVLCNRRRRRVIAYLEDSGGEATAGELAEAIAAEEEDTTVAHLSSDDRKRVYVSLYQNHLPVMDDAGVVEYDADRKTVRMLRPSDVDPYLAAPDRVDRRPAVAVALAGAALVLAGGLQVGAFAATPAAVWPVLGGVGLVGAAALGVYRPG